MEVERRIDPEDGKARTFDELVQHYKSVYSIQEVQQYWDTRCRLDVPTDPFLTSLQQPAPEFKLRPDHEPPTAPASQVNLGNVKLSEDPFLAASFSQSKHPPALPVHQEVYPHKEVHHWSESISSCLGAGDVNRQPRARTTLIMVPIFLFIWELLVWSLVSHISRNGCWLMTITLFIISAAAIGMWYQGIRWGPVSLVALGVLCIIAIIGGTVLGQRGWDDFWRQFFWMNVGYQLVPTFASTAAGARSDAATLAFGTVEGSLDHSSVDASRSVGFKDTNLFCVAPVLSPETAGADFPRVNFWAVGMDCCTKSGVFTCDAARDFDAVQAVVLREGGYPCPSCNVETFQKAIAKAEATFGLVSAPDALLIRWVRSANKVKFHAGGMAVAYLLLCMLMGSGFLFILGWLSWYYGFGKRAPSGGVGQSFAQAPGRCDPAKGLCYYENRENGYPCDDGIFYTLNDSCQDGACTGIPDYCLGYNVSCIPLNPCLVNGKCNPATGRCTYQQLPDETPCDDGRLYTVQDMCQKGLCVGRPQDLCEQFGVVCEAPNWCYDPGICDPKTGTCSEATLAPGYRSCNDQDRTTYNDTCIEGVCMGILDAGYLYQTMGAGECVDRQDRRMARYTGDVKEQSECESICTGDPQCAGYAYNFPLCSIYGTVRTTLPLERQDWSFQAGTDPVAVIIEKALVLSDVQRRSICRKKGVEGDRIESPSDLEVEADEFFSPVRIGIFFVIVFACFFALPLTDYISRLLKCRKDPLEDLAGQVTQDPASGDWSEKQWIDYGDGHDGQLELKQDSQDLRGTAGEQDEALALPPDAEGSPDPPPESPPNPPGKDRES